MPPDQIGIDRDKIRNLRVHIRTGDEFAEKADLMRRRELAAMQAAAEQGLWSLADYHLPADIRETANRWKLGTVLCEIWRQAWIAGWRAAHVATERSRQDRHD
jgi:hypothetical protein